MSRAFFPLRSLAVAAVLSALAGGVTHAADERPNILFIMSDDHTDQALGSYGSRLADLAPTTHIDRLAEEGMRFENFFVTNSICVPSRASILTGQYSHINEVYTLRDRLDPDRPTVAKMLQDAGYQTAVVGKWHLKSEPQGFDYWKVLPGQGRYHDPVFRTQDGDRVKHEGFSADVIGDLTLDWLKGRSSDEPFCLMTHFKSSHEPWGYPDRYADRYADTVIPEPPSLWEDLSHRSPGSRAYGFTIDTMAHRLARRSGGSWPPNRSLDEMTERQRKRAAYQRFLKHYLRCVAAIDDNVGRILQYLDKAGLAENTIVIYTSDQGYFLGEHNYIDKRWMYEQSLRMPLLVRYPGHIQPGSVTDAIGVNVDFAPTFLDYAGVETPDAMQGRSLRPILEGDTPSDWRDAMYYRYWMHANGARRPAHYGIRTQRYKLIFFYGLALGHTNNKPTKPGWELYDLAKDPHEMDNVYRDPAYADVVARLKKKLLAKKKKLGDTDEKFPKLMKRREKHW